jgi:hypothetical protein
MSTSGHTRSRGHGARHQIGTRRLHPRPGFKQDIIEQSDWPE